MRIDGLRVYLTREVALRFLASLALSLILWALVTLREDPEINRVFPDVQVHAVNLDESLVILNEIPDVRVELSGPRSDVNPIESNTLLTSIDLASVTNPGIYELPISLDSPEGVWRSELNPSIASIEVERSASKPFGLAPVISDLDQNNLRTVTVYPDVNQVTVSGASSLVDSIAKVVLPVQVGGGTQTFEDVYIPEARDADGAVIAGVTIEPSAVTATVRVSARGKSVAVLATISGSPAPGFEVADRTINPQFVIVDGDETVLNSLVALSTEPIDVTGVDASFNRTVNIADLPEGVQILQPSNGEVEVLVQIMQRGVRQSLPSQQVTIVGIGPGLEASVTPNEITIDVVAPEDALALLDANTLQVVVDATGLAPGTYSVKPSVIMPPRVQWVTSLPTEVTLTITESPEGVAPHAATVVSTPKSAP